MPHSKIQPADIRSQHPMLDDHDAAGRRVMLTEILAQVSHEALQGDTLEAVLHAIVDCITRRLPVTIASIILLNEERTHFIQEVWSGHIDLDLPAGLPWPVTVGAAGRCARTGKSQLITDLREDSDYVPGNSAVSSEYLVPIRHRERLHGVLNLESTRVDFFTHEVCTVFDVIAGQVAGAIHVTRLFRHVEVANRKLSDLSMRDGLTGIANRRCFDEGEWPKDGGVMLLMALRRRCPGGTAIASRRRTTHAVICTAMNACGNSHGFAQETRAAMVIWSPCPRGEDRRPGRRVANLKVPMPSRRSCARRSSCWAWRTPASNVRPAASEIGVSAVRPQDECRGNSHGFAQETRGDGDLVARYGGEEIVILLPRVSTQVPMPSRRSCARRSSCWAWRILC